MSSSAQLPQQAAPPAISSALIGITLFQNGQAAWQRGAERESPSPFCLSSTTDHSAIQPSSYLSTTLRHCCLSLARSHALSHPSPIKPSMLRCKARDLHRCEIVHAPNGPFGSVASTHPHISTAAPQPIASVACCPFGLLRVPPPLHRLRLQRTISSSLIRHAVVLQSRAEAKPSS